MGEPVSTARKEAAQRMHGLATAQAHLLRVGAGGGGFLPPLVKVHRLTGGSRREGRGGRKAGGHGENETPTVAPVEATSPRLSPPPPFPSASPI